MSSTVLLSDCFLVQAPLAGGDGIIFGRNAHPTDEGAAAGGVEVVNLAANADAPAAQKCSSLEVPGGGAPTFAAIINRPAGVVWGADFGANEKKITVAVSWSEEPSGDDRLSATDLTRLALERSASTDEAIANIVALAEEHNTDDVGVKQCFVICAEKQLWLLNVVGKLWAAELVTDGFRQIGAGLSIGTNVTKGSDDLQTKAQDLALWNGTDPFDFSQIFHPTESGASAAAATPTDVSPFGITEMFGVLRAAANKSTGASQVSEISADAGGSAPVTCHWFTATPDPTESVFKPFVFTRSVRISPLTQLPGDDPDDATVTRLHKLHQQRNWATVGPLLESLETSCVQEVHNFLSSAESASQELDELLKDCVEAEVKFYR